jgi:hypothetical protein
MKTTGVRLIPRVALIDRELWCQTGAGLDAWAAARGVRTNVLVQVIDGRTPDAAGLLVDLAETLGVSVAALRATNATAGA